MSSQSFTFGASPSVSKERWIKHAVHKLSKGYNLIINRDRKVANFYKGYGDFEACSYKTARKLVAQEFVVLVGEHEMGMEYQLKSKKNLKVEEVPVEEEEDVDEIPIDAEDAAEVIDADELDDGDEGADFEDDEDEPRRHDDDDE